MTVPINRAFLLLTICFLSLTLISCGGHPTVKNPSYIGKPGTLAPVIAPEYRINPGDQLDVKFFNTPELNEQIVVRPDGKISLQLIDEVMAAGRTPSELTQELKEKYKGELTNPAVTVIVRTSSNMKVFVDGEINKPGVMPLVGSMTVMQAIAESGGLKDTAKPTEIVVVRQKTDLTGPMAIPINIEKVVDGTRMQEDILLQPYDIVYVPASRIGNAAKWVDLYLRRTILVLPQEFLLYYGAVTK